MVEEVRIEDAARLELTETVAVHVVVEAEDVTIVTLKEIVVMEIEDNPVVDKAVEAVVMLLKQQKFTRQYSNYLL